MSQFIRMLAVSTILLTFLSACGMLFVPAYTPAPTPICPIVTATPTQVSQQAMGITQPPEQMTFQGKPFPPLNLNDYLYSSKCPFEELTWNVPNGKKLNVEITQGIMNATVMDPVWHGSETIHLETCDPAGTCATQDIVYTVAEEGALKITYVCNEGFIIETSEKKVMIDAIFFGSPPICSDAYNNLRKAVIKKALPPFDNADLLLASHVHSDHFYLHTVGDYLQNSPKSVLLTDSNSASLLMTNYDDDGYDRIKDRIQAVRIPSGGSKRVTIQGIDLEIIPSAPGEEFSLAFILRLDGFTIFHAGDSGSGQEMADFYKAYDLAGKGIDIAFVPWWNMMESHRRSILEEGIHARQYIPMHIQAGETCLYQKIQDYYPQAILLTQEMQSWQTLKK
jgi:L-ascorbate metabolism protein UlaG (beta-lactamase superfamily)